MFSVLFVWIHVSDNYKKELKKQQNSTEEGTNMQCNIRSIVNYV